MMSHMITSAPSLPPRRTKSSIVMLRQALGVAVDQLEELAVPFLVVEAGALADHLVREAAGADHRHLEVLGIGLDRLARCALPSLKQRLGLGSGCCRR